ncbi:hypothetical protein J1N35_022074 [Gossypium stocksii]|uniref:Retrovirus-related Pol polyprotein from transposon TNT 1-94-like beta-barrel domain-containing protein n=1 Tax=Gossypium stocksii TaxID=47602 RepID=A0A9D4A1X6_9ROSI|nr:hypothetical protein J1N35_022074 [Gossypium stocksii]
MQKLCTLYFVLLVQISIIESPCVTMQNRYEASLKSPMKRQVKPEKGIKEMSDRFTHIINGLKALRKIYPNKEMVKKMLNSLPMSWEAKVTKIEESKDLNSLSLNELISSLLTYEMKINRNAQKFKEAPKKVGVAFKLITCENDDDSSNDDDEEEMVVFVKKSKKFMKFKKVKIPKKRHHQGDEDNEVANLCLIAIEEPKEEHYFKASNSKNSWYLDSGCSRHMTIDSSHFKELMPKNGGEVTFGDNSKGLIEGTGSIGISSFTFIKNVLYVNGLKHNLLSISQLSDHDSK